ncbi:MAG: M28 family peptidase [bacterium]|nr:M28 family peptidase [bacterium]
MKSLVKYLPILVLLLAACQETPNKKAKEAVQTTAAYKQVSPNFNADSAFLFIEKQVSFGPRVCNSAAHTACGNYLTAEFKKYADEVIEQKATVNNWDKSKLQIRNIIASFNPKAEKRVLICSHWDSRPYADNDPNPQNHNTAIDAADDGASGVAVMLEMARILAQNKPNIGIDFICLDAEDLGKSDLGGDTYCLGSQYWSKTKHKPGYKANYGILLDMVGAYNARFIWEGFSMKYAEPVLRKVWDQGVQLGYSNYFYYYQGGFITDDHKYINEVGGIPTIDIIHYSENTNSGFPAHWHTLNDKLNVIDRNTLKAVGQTLLEVIYKEN